MFDTTNPLTIFAPVQRAGASPTRTSPETDGLDDTFQQMLMMSMLSGVSSSGEEGSSSSMLLLPMMLTLIERLIEQQVEHEEESQAPAESSELAQASPVRLGPSSQPYGRPVSGRLTQSFHAGHNGLDMGIPVGTPVQTTMDGKVVYAGWNNEGYGNLVIVENGPYRTYYAHLSEIPVRIGDAVTAGSTIGLSGNTGNSTGPHLHYEVRYQMKNIDPTSFTLVT